MAHIEATFAIIGAVATLVVLISVLLVAFTKDMWK